MGVYIVAVKTNRPEDFGPDCPWPLLSMRHVSPTFWVGDRGLSSHGNRNGLSGKRRKNLIVKILKFPFANSSAVKDTVKTLNEFQSRTHMKNLWIDWVEFSIEGKRVRSHSLRRKSTWRISYKWMMLRTLKTQYLYKYIVNEEKLTWRTSVEKFEEFEILRNLQTWRIWQFWSICKMMKNSNYEEFQLLLVALPTV